MTSVWRPTGPLASRMRWLIGFTVAAAMLCGALLSCAYVYMERIDRLADRARQAAGHYRPAALDAASSSSRETAQSIVSRVAESAGATAVEIETAADGTLASVRSGGDAAWWRPELTVSVPLEVLYDRVGTLHVSMSRGPAFTAVLWMLLLQAVALLLALALAVVATRRMRETVTGPINGLLDTVERVAHEQDYSLRAQPEGPDEIGSLINSFNEMLSQIRERDERLAVNRRELQELVIERTRNLESAAKEAEQSSRAKGDFLARMSHEIRTPMNGVVGMAELLQNTALDERQQRMLQTMRRSADALLEIINDILDFSRIEAGRLQVISDDFALTEMIEDVCDLLASRAQERGLELVCHVDKAVPAWGNGDPVRLRQIVINLLGNAIKYTERGHIVVRARLAGQDEMQFRLRVEVEDTGLGIPEDELSRVFEAFTQVDSFETRKHGGTGLGLAITRQLVGLLAGELGVTSKLGQGSCFWFELPLANATRMPRIEPWALPSTRVLLVEAHEAGAAAIRELLAGTGVEVEVARSGTRALELLAMYGPFGLLVVDCRLPDMDGSELLQRMVTSGLPPVPVVMLTPVVAPPSRDGESACEPDEWLVKPVRRTRLAETVNRALGLAVSESRESGEHTLPAIRSLGLRVLLVEDSPVNLEVAGGMLDALGCEVVTASDGTLGVEHALGRRFDVVLMDCQMPLMDGYEATRKIRAAEAANQRAAVPIVAITANALPGDRERCLAAGMTDFISKPFTLRKLQAVMQAVTGIAGQAMTPTGPDDTTPSHALPVVEVGQIEELRSLGRPQIVRQAILLFLKQAAQKLDALDAALAALSFEDAVQAAHSLKSSALSVGGRRFAGVAGDCETAARSTDIEALRRHARQLRPEFGTLCKALSSLAQAEERAA